MRWSTAVLLAPALAGCSFIYNPNNLPDPRMIDAAVVDANPCALTVTGIAPALIKEGQGDSGSPPALLVIHGDNIVNTNLKVDLESQDGSTVHLEPITDAVASADHTYVAFTVTAHVDTALMTDVALKVTVTQDAPQDGSCMGKATGALMDKLTLHGLPELTTLTTTLLSEYSMVTLSNVTFPSSANPVAIKAVSSIMLGTVAANASGATAGPGAFSAGGMPGPGAGGGGTPAPALGFGGGGGGGGFAMAGTGGANGAGTGGPPGPPSGQDQILSIGGNLASAGGVGGAGLAALGGSLLLGGGGGGGGGVVVLTAGGDITTGAISANGGPGTSPSGGSILGGGGGGGGGAGGTVVVRTTAGTLKTGVIHVAVGLPGSPGGGTGSVGRVRWDAPASPVLMSPDRPAHRGPAFKDATRVVTTPGQSFTLMGTSGDEFDVYMIDSAGILHAGEHASFNGGGIATITPSLSAGYNALCVKLAGGMQSEPVANACIDVAFLP